MGMVKCKVHGISHITQYCSHIGSAIDGGTIERAFVVIDGWNNPNVLCSQCFAKALDVVKRSRESSGQVPFDFDFGDGTSEGGCTRCLAEWVGATGQGELSEAVRGARARDGRPGP